MTVSPTQPRRRQYKPVRLVEKFGLTEGGARVVIAASRKSRKAARRLARAMQGRFETA